MAVVPLVTADYPELKNAVVDQDGSIVGYVSSVPILVNVLNQYEKLTGTIFNVVYSRSTFGQTDIKSSKKHSVQWDTSDNLKGPSVPFCGIPFLVLDSLRLECHFGRDRSRARKDRRLQQIEEAANDAGCAPKRARAIPASVKISCPSTIICTEIVFFSDFEILEDSKTNRSASSRMVKAALADGDWSGSIDRRIYLRLPASDSHSDHPRGESAGLTLQLDKRIAAFIRSQVVLGENDVDVVEKLVRRFVADEIPDAWSAGPLNRRYYPKRKIINEHMYRERQRLQSLHVNEEQLLNVIEQWTTDGDSVFFRPSGDNSERRLLLVHQTKYQQNLLNLYGNDVCLLDAVYRAIRYSLPIYFIAVRTNVNYAVVATFVVHNDDCLSIVEAIDVIKSWNILWKPMYFLADSCKSERKAVLKCFTETTVFLSDHQREQAWKRWMDQATYGASEQQKELMEILCRIATSATPASYEENLRCLQASDIWLSSKHLRDWFIKDWKCQSEQWVWCFRPGLLNVLTRQTENVDNEQKSLRHKCLAGLTDKSLTVVLTAIKHFVNVNYNRYATLNAKACELVSSLTVGRNPKYLQSRTPDLVRHCCDRLASVWDVSGIQLVGADNYAVSSTSDVTYLVNLTGGGDLPSCQCLDWAQTLWPCKHMLTVLETYDCWNAMPERYLSSQIFYLDESCLGEVESSSSVEIGDSVVISDCIEEEIDFKTASLLAVENSDSLVVVSQPGSGDKPIARCRELLKCIHDFTYVDLPDGAIEAVNNGLNQLLNGLKQAVPAELHPSPTHSMAADRNAGLEPLDQSPKRLLMKRKHGSKKHKVVKFRLGVRKDQPLNVRLNEKDAGDLRAAICSADIDDTSSTDL